LHIASNPLPLLNLVTWFQSEDLRMVEHTNLEEYDDPEIYDFENHAFEPDGPFYLDLAQRIGGPVLELGCGAGRIAIPLAQQRIDITGLDTSDGMLALAQRKATDLPIQWIGSDARDFHLPTRFRFIYMAGGSFHHMLRRADQEALLARVREHLEAEGVFAFDMSIPRPGMLKTVHDEEPWYSYTDPHGREVRLSGTAVYDPLLQIKHETAYRRWTDANGVEVTKRARLALRYVFPQELEALLYYNGFTILEQYGNWDGGPLTAESRTVILVCVTKT
jgi:SAM-dependent methyltransferase